MTPQSAAASGHAGRAPATSAAPCGPRRLLRSLVSSERWFDELYIWTEGGAASTTQRAKIQIDAMSDAFKWLE